MSKWTDAIINTLHNPKDDDVTNYILEELATIAIENFKTKYDYTDKEAKLILSKAMETGKTGHEALIYGMQAYKSQLDKENMPKLKKLAQLGTDQSGKPVVTKGNTDPTGTKQSQLTGYEIPQQKPSVVTKGYTDPTGAKPTPQKRQQLSQLTGYEIPQQAKPSVVTKGVAVNPNTGKKYRRLKIPKT